jgi:biofilm PGA synthesis N-glycosyltransferase PgaC
MNGNGHRYIIISPVRDEEKYLAKTIESVIKQTIRPIEYILVDDGSTDRTPEIIKEASKVHPWIRYVKRPDRGERKVGPGVVEAFYDGFKNIQTIDYDFIGKMDGDLTFGPLYFETLLNKFDCDPYLGSASGKLFLDLKNGKLAEERMSDEMVIGGMKFFRRECFEDIEGFVKEVMWDGIAYHRCRQEGWRTRSFHNEKLNVIDNRLMGSSHKSIFHGRLRWGWGQYFMGTHPLYILAVGFYRLFERPYIFGGIMIVLGYLKGWFNKSPRFNHPNFRKSLHAWQFERLKMGKRLESIPSPTLAYKI